MDIQKNNKEETDFNDASNNPSASVKPQEKELLPDQIFDPEMPRMIKWVIKYSGGIIKDEKQANYLLIIIAVAILATSFLFMFGIPGSSPLTKPLLQEAHPGILIK